MPFVAQGAATQLAETYVLVRATPSGLLVDPDAGTLTLVINDPDGDPILSLTESQLTRVSLGRFAYSWQTAVDQVEGPYAFVWDGAVNGVELPPAVDEVEVIPAGTLTTSLVTVAQVRALLTTELTDPQLQDVIDREQSSLEAAMIEAGGGPLAGPRTEVIVTTLGDDYRLVKLTRPTDSVSVMDNGTLVDSGDIRLLDGRFIRRVATGRWARGRWLGVLEVTYTPSDLARVQKGLIDLIRDSAETSDAGSGQVASESIGEYSYTLASGAVKHGRQWSIVRSLLPPSTPVSVSLSDTSLPYWVGTVRPGG